jgi:hypothetical protein
LQVKVKVKVRSTAVLLAMEGAGSSVHVWAAEMDGWDGWMDGWKD